MIKLIKNMTKATTGETINNILTKKTIKSIYYARSVA